MLRIVRAFRLTPAPLVGRSSSLPSGDAHARGWYELKRGPVVAPERSQVERVQRGAGGGIVLLRVPGAWHVLGPLDTVAVTAGAELEAGALVGTGTVTRWCIATRPDAWRDDCQDEAAVCVSLDAQAWLHGHERPWPPTHALDPGRAPTELDDALCGEVLA